MRLRLLTVSATITAALLAYGCANDSVTAPSSAPVAAPAAASQSLLGSLLGQPTTVTPLLRKTPLPSAVTASATIGPLGGVLALPSAGLTVVVPPLAVTKPTKMSVTAVAGSSVAYEFEPHGIKFTIPLGGDAVLEGDAGAERRIDQSSFAVRRLLPGWQAHHERVRAAQPQRERFGADVGSDHLALLRLHHRDGPLERGVGLSSSCSDTRGNANSSN